MKRAGRALDRLLIRTGLALFPVRVRRGIAAGARWTLYPYTSYWRGTYEPHTQAAIMNLAEGGFTGWTCWDLGAHYGAYSVGLALRTGPGGQVAAFEPNPASFTRLERHRRMNGLTWLKTFNLAASDATGTANLFGDAAATTTHLLYEGEHQAASDAVARIATVRLDELVAAGELQPPRFVKIDVEGHGHRAMEGMRATLTGHRPILLVAVHSPQERDGILAILSPLGYELRPIGPRPVALDMIGQDFLFMPRE